MDGTPPNKLSIYAHPSENPPPLLDSGFLGHTLFLFVGTGRDGSATQSKLDKLQRLLAVVSKLDSNQQNAFIMPKLDIRACARLILQDGSKEDKRKLLEQLKSRIILRGGKLIVEKTKKI